MMMETLDYETSQGLGITCIESSLSDTSTFYAEVPHNTINEVALDVSVHTAGFFPVFYSTHCDER